MTGRTRTVLNFAVAVAAAAVGVWFISVRYGRFCRTGEGGAQVWFYDEQKRQLYAVPRDTVPPDGRGVRAVVVGFRGEEKDPAKHRVVYLETYGQPLKDAIERTRSARLSGNNSKPASLSRESDLFRTNDLVKRVGEMEWHVAGSPEGRKVITEWQTWRAADGREPVVCMP